MATLRPAQVMVAAFLATIAAGTICLMLPFARSGEPSWPAATAIGEPTVFGPTFGDGAPMSVALFTSTSASAVTGLNVVDAATYWSAFGKSIIVVLMQLGGIGTMTFAALIGLMLARRFGTHQRAIATASTGILDQSEVRGVVVRIASFSFAIEFVAVLLLTARFLALGHDAGESVGQGVFLAVSAFNNAGFAPYTDSLMGFATDPWVIMPIAVLIIVGGLGFPVLVVLRKFGLRWHKWHMNARLVVVGTIGLIVHGAIAIGMIEWRNPATLGPMDAPAKVLNSFFASVSPRTAGFNAIDIAGQREETWVITDMLMFIGGGPAGTAGGIKITTALVLVFIVITEIRGDRAVNILGRRLSRSVHRQALTVVLLSAGLVVSCTMALMINTNVNLDRSLYEVVSAFGTVGLSTGITPCLPTASQIMLVVLMILGRMGPLTIATALALKKRTTLYELPKDRPLIG